MIVHKAKILPKKTPADKRFWPSKDIQATSYNGMHTLLKLGRERVPLTETTESLGPLTLSFCFMQRDVDCGTEIRDFI